ncbi:MAG: endonuclease MutS2 [Syntrophobacteria bacterium]
MDRQSLRVLEFPQIQKYLWSLAVTEPGRRAADHLHPGTDRQQIETWLAQVTELKEFLQIGTSLPLAGTPAVGDLLAGVRENGQSLTPEQLLKVAGALATARKLHQLASQCGPRYPTLSELLKNLEPLPDLEARVDRAVDQRGRIQDGASPELARIRKEIGTLRQRLHQELAEILERLASQKTLRDKLVSVRNDRLVIPLRSDARAAVDGIVHDTSQTGATCFIEPFSVVPLNNRLSQARSREREEEARILRELTGGVMAAAATLHRNEKWLGRIDCVHAKVRLSFLLRARAPQLNDGADIRLLQAMHPVLALQERAQDPSALPEALAEMVLGGDTSTTGTTAGLTVVPIDLQLGGERRTLIISGANTGGKTVSLKTLGLLGLMVQAGMHIPVAEGSEWPVLAGIFAEIGDEQDVRAHLSTFSARVKRLAAMVQEVDSRSLILLDEFGTGTDPAEGSALALAVLDELRGREPFIAVTTHYHLLKAYGMLQNGVENVSVLFDDNTGRPTYRLLYGYPGTSNALEIAADLGMSSELIEAARNYLDRNERRIIELIRHLEEACQRARTQEEEWRSQRRQFELARANLAREREELVQSREEILDAARQKARRLLDEAEQELKSTVGHFQRKGMKGAMTARRKVRQISEELNAGLEPRVPDSTDVAAPEAEGKLVRLRGLGGTGTLIKIKDQGQRAEVQMGSKRVEVDTKNLECLPSQQSEQSAAVGSSGIRVFREEPETCGQRVDLLGLRVEEALTLLDRTIDRAILDGCAELHVVHGHGSGRLRQAVQEFLTDHAAVKGFHPEMQNRGGSGVTVVELKD